MDAVFLKILNMSIAAGWLILAVVVLRFLLKKAPKYIACFLWAMVAIRLIYPVSFESALSLIPSAETVSPDILYTQEPVIHSGVSALNSVVNPVITESFAPTPGASVNPLQIWTSIASYVWLLGIVVMLVFSAVSYLRLRKKVGASLHVCGKLWICDDIKTPFILGIIKPRIYLPSGMDEAQQAHVIAHEGAHLKRCDHWWKPLGFLLLVIYWFNPLCWLAYILLCRDIELACDEKVIRAMGKDDVIAYSEALFSCSTPRRMVMACPLAFGEVGVKIRIKKVLNYRKPAFWIIIVAVIACVIVAVCFLTNPINDSVQAPHENSFSKEPPNLDYVEPTVEVQRLSLNDVILLSQKGEALSWDDFDGFSYVETGSGLYIRVYDINPVFSLWIGGGSTDSEPMYISLHTNTEPEDSIDIRTENVTDFIRRHKDDSLDAAISAAVLEHEKETYNPGNFACESHVILNSLTTVDNPEKSDSESTIIVYALVLYQEYSTYGKELRSVGGSHIPTAFTFRFDTAGNYTLEEYWTPRDGSYYANDIRRKFPKGAANQALDTQQYVERQQKECDEKAQAYLSNQESVDKKIAGLLETICSSPTALSNPSDYIKEYQTEFDTLVSYGEHTLRYCYSDFLKGGQTDLRGHIMMAVCKKIMLGWGEDLALDNLVLTGQDWFDGVRDYAEVLQQNYSTEDIEKFYPSIWLLLQMQAERD